MRTILSKRPIRINWDFRDSRKKVVKDLLPTL